jgi:Methyltransferase domain
MLRSQLAALDRALRAGKIPSIPFFERLVQHWANPSWSAQATFLSSMLGWLSKTSGAVLECGSGLTTLVLAVAESSSARRVVSLEHDSTWAARVSAAMPRALRGRVHAALTPIRDYGDFDWYSIDNVPSLSMIGFIVCDGPPGATRGGRYGVVPVLRERIAPGCIILLDDAHRADERAIVDRWCFEYSAAIVEATSTHCVLQVGRP